MTDVSEIIESVEIVEIVRRGRGRPKQPVIEEVKAQQKKAYNKYQNEYYHAHKTLAACSCGMILRGNRMGAHMKTARHTKALEFLQSQTVPPNL